MNFNANSPPLPEFSGRGAATHKQLCFWVTMLGVSALMPFAGAAVHQTNGSASDVQAKINGAATGDTVLIPAGTFLWTTTVVIPATKGITLQGATQTTAAQGAGTTGTTIQRNNGTSTSFDSLQINVGNTNPGTRVTGIYFKDTGSAGQFGDPGFIQPNGGPGNALFRIDNCTFDHDAPSSLKHSITVYGTTPGLIDHCTFIYRGVVETIHNVGRLPAGATTVLSPDWTDDVIQSQQLFIEDCRFINNVVPGESPPYPNGNSSAIQNYRGVRMTFRHNYCLSALVDVHGTERNAGGRWWEIYENDFVHKPGTGMDSFIHLRAGSGVVFNNRRNMVGGAPRPSFPNGLGSIKLWEEDPASGYPCTYQVGRGKNMQPDPAYLWNNWMLPFTQGPEASSGGGPSAVVLNRDYFNAVKPGYTPYTYPHPLQSSGDGSTPTPPPTPSQFVTYYVDKDHASAADKPSNGSQSTPFATIGYALRRIAGGDTILIKQSAAPYDIGNGIFIFGPSGTAQNPTQLKAFPGHTPHLRGVGNKGRFALDGIQHWVVEGLEISNLNHVFAVRNSAANITVRNCNFHDSGNQLVHVHTNVSNVLFEGCTLTAGGSIGTNNNGEGFYVGNNSGNDFTNNITIRGCTINGMKHEGIEFKADTHDCIAEDNVVSNCVANFDFGRWSISAHAKVAWGQSPNHIIRRNTILNHGGFGTGAAILAQVGSQICNNVVYSVFSPAYAVETGGSGGDTIYIWHNTFDIPEARAIHNLGGALSIGNNIGPSTNGNLAFNSSFFLNSANHDYHLVPASAPVNAGGTVPFQLANDFAGVARVAPFDIGAFEYSGQATTPSSLSWESTRGVIQAPFVNNGNSIWQTSATFDPRQGGEALYNFSVTAAGDYTVSVVVNAPHQAANSLFVDIDSQPSNPAMIWDIPPSTGFTERVVSWRGNGTDTNNEFTPKKFSLSAGSHQLIIRGREGNVQIGRITVGPAAPSAPSNLAVVER